MPLLIAGMPTVPRAENRPRKYRRAPYLLAPRRDPVIAGRLATGAPDGLIYSWKMFSDTTFAAVALALHSYLEDVFRHNLHRPFVHHRMRPCHREELVEPPHAQAGAPSESPECPCSLQGRLRPAPRTRLCKYRRCGRSHGSPARFSYTAGRLATGPWLFIYSWKVF